MDTKSTLIKQPYSVTMARHKFNMPEYRVFIRILEKLQPDMVYNPETEDDRTLNNQHIKLTTSSLLPPGDKNHACVESALNSLMRKEIVIRVLNPDKSTYKVTTRLVLQHKYTKSKEAVEIGLNPDIFHCLLNNRKGFTSYRLDVAFKTSTPYSLRLYQFIAHWRDKSHKTLMLDVVRDICCLGEKYSYSGNVLQRIIQPAMKDLQERADVWFSIKKPIKEVRKIIGWVLQIHHRDGNKNQKKPHHLLLRTPKTRKKQSYRRL